MNQLTDQSINQLTDGPKDWPMASYSRFIVRQGCTVKPRSCELAYYKKLILKKQNSSPFIVISLLISPHSWKKLILEKKNIQSLQICKTEVWLYIYILTFQTNKATDV